MLQVHRLCINILMTAYAAAILVGASSTNLYQKIVIVSDGIIFISRTQIHFFSFHISLTEKIIQVSGHVLLASTLWQRAQQFDIENKDCITQFYMFIGSCVSLCPVIYQYAFYESLKKEKVLKEQDYTNVLMPTDFGFFICSYSTPSIFLYHLCSKESCEEQHPCYRHVKVYC